MAFVFLSYSYRPEFRDIAELNKKLIVAMGFGIATGEDVAGEFLTPAIIERIKSCDLVVALLSPHLELPDGTYQPPPWVQEEVAFALAHAKPTICLVFDKVARPAGATGLVWLPLARDALADGFVALAANLAQSRRKLEARRVRRVRAITGVALLASSLVVGAYFVIRDQASVELPALSLCRQARELSICAEQEAEFPCQHQALELARSCAGQTASGE